MNTVSYDDAINLMIENLYKKDYEIRIEAKHLNCEEELDAIKKYILDQLTTIKSNLL